MNVTSDFTFADAEISYRAPSPAAKHGPFARFTAWLSDMPRRRQVLNELRSLSDHELADIGLSRGDLHRVFEPDFVATYRS